MESKVGAGIDFYALKDRLRFSFEGFDFDRDPQPQFRFRTRVTTLKYLHLLLGLDDFAFSANREVFFGLQFGF
jgi:hypothetical protein